MHCQRNNSSRMVHEAGRFWLCGRFTSSGCAELVSQKDSSCKHALLFIWPHHQNQMVSPIASVAMLAATDKEVNWIGSCEGIPRVSVRRKVPAVEAEEHSSHFFTEFRIFSSLWALHGIFTITLSMSTFLRWLQSKQELHCRKLWIERCTRSVSLCWDELSQRGEIPRNFSVGRD